MKYFYVKDYNEFGGWDAFAIWEGTSIAASLTAWSSISLKEHCLGNPYDDHLSKPPLGVYIFDYNLDVY